MGTTKESRYYAFGVGGWFVLLGILGFVYADADFTKTPSDELFGFLLLNAAWNIFHLVLGGLGLLLAFVGHARLYALVAGWVLIIVAVAGFWVGAGELILSEIPADTGLSVMHLVLGIAGVACGWRSQRELREAGEFQRSERGY